jgi:chemotaxis protein MotB
MAMPSLHRASKHHEEGWIVSYADMMTLLFGFFVILNSFADMDDRKLEEFGKQVADNLNGKYVDKAVKITGADTDAERQARAFRLLLSLMNPGANVNEEMKRVEALTAATSADASAKQIVTEGIAKETAKYMAVARDGVAADSVVEISLPATTLFAAGSDELRPEAVGKLRELSATLSRLNGLTTVEVVGHTDSSLPDRSSKYRSNWAMSSARAGTVADALVASGVRREMLLIRGMADLAPLYPERSPTGAVIPENQEKNRRVSIVVKKSLSKGR